MSQQEIVLIGFAIFLLALIMRDSDISMRIWVKGLFLTGIISVFVYVGYYFGSLDDSKHFHQEFLLSSERR